MAIVILVPVLRRPANVAPLLESIDGHRVLFLVSPGDGAELRALRRADAEYLVVPFDEGDGDYARKINYGFTSTTEEWIFTGADDLGFTEGWFTEAMAVTEAHHGVVGTNDTVNKRVLAGRHSTHSLVRRSYIDEHGTVDERGKVLHEGYVHNFVDDELVATARRRGAWIFAARSIVVHHHPNYDPTIERDSTYVRGAARFQRDARLFRQRSANRFA